MKRRAIILSASLLLALTACSEKKAEAPSEPVATDSKSAQPAAKAPVPAAKTPEAPAETTAQDTETVTNDACLAAVKKETNESDLAVISNEFSEANTLVMVGVGANRAPWRCLVSNSGEVAEVMFEGSDSGGVPEPVAGNDLADFVGAKGGQAEMGLTNKGYELARTEGLTAFWWNAGSGACAKIVTADGRYQSIDMVSPNDCGK